MHHIQSWLQRSIFGRMTEGLKRFQHGGDLHFVTFSCYQRRPYLISGAARGQFEDVLEKTRNRFHFYILGYVVMPEHVHLLLSEPEILDLAAVFHALKLSMSKSSEQRPFWQARYYDFNVFSARKHIEKLRYIHRNPVRRGLVKEPQEWKWSSFRHYAFGERGVVEIESSRTAAWREETRAVKGCKRLVDIPG